MENYSHAHENIMMNKEVMITGKESNLPSTLVRETMPRIEEEEIHLRDYLDVIMRRKWVVIVTLLVTFFTVALFTFSSTPLYLATGMIKASPTSKNITSFQGVDDSFMKSQEYISTQVKLLQSESLLRNLITVMDLKNNEFFNGNSDSDSEGGFISGIKDTMGSVKAAIKDIIRPQPDSSLSDNAKQRLEEQVALERTLKKIHDALKVTPVKDTQLIEISIESERPKLAADMVNTLMNQFMQGGMDSQLAAFQSAETFLEKQIEAAKIKLEKSEKELNQYASLTGIISLDSKLNLTMRQLEEVNEALAQAITLRINRESLYRQTLKGDSDNLPTVLNNLLMQDLKKEYSKLLSEYQKLSTVFKDEYPDVKKIKAQMADLQNRYDYEKQRIIDSIRLEYETTLENENRLRKKAELQQKLALELNDKATQYKILQREVDSNREVYNSLLIRSKEISASAGSESGHIEIIDTARQPLHPYKPKVLRQLLLGIVLGLFGGIGLAFGLEYMDNTVKTPDEFSKRYQLPILGLIPFAENKSGDEYAVALTSYINPKDPLAEAIRTSMYSIELSSAESQPKSFLITSVLPDTGKSTIAANFSLSLLTLNAKVLVIETDLRKPTLHKIFDGKINNKVGLSSFLAGIVEVDQIINKTEFDNLYFIPSGPIPPNPAELLASSRMRNFISAVGQEFDYVILDAPPFYGFAEILILSNMVDGVILVSELNKTPRDGIQYFKRAVTNVNGNILGVLVNKVHKTRSGYYYGGYSYNNPGSQYGNKT